MAGAVREAPLPPRVGGLPLVGALHRLARDPLNQLRALTEVGDVARVRLGPRDVYFVNHPKLAHEVLGERPDEFVKAGLGKERMRPLGGDGIALADGETWSRARRMINPLFGRRRLAALAPPMTAAIAEHLDTWERAASSDDPIDLSLEIASLSLNALTSTMFSESLSASERQQLGRDWRTVMTWIQIRVFTPGLPEWVPLPTARRGREALARIEKKLHAMIDQRSGGSDEGDLLDALVSASADGSRFDRVELRDHAINLMFAGHETTAATLTFALVLLEQHPEWAERVVAEIDCVLGATPPDFEDLQRLPMTRACWEEALRVAPPGTVAPRSAVRDTELGGFAIPAGSIVLINYVGVQSHPDFWESPERYDPSRFLGPEGATRSRAAHLPFGAGPRACVGALMGNMEGVFVLAMVLQRYRLTLAPGASLRASMRGTIHFREGPPMLVRKRLPAGATTP